MNSQELRALQEAYSQVYELDEEKVELKQRNKNEMQRKAGNLGREVVSSKKGPKRTAAMDRMGKLVSSIARDDEEKRFKTLGQSPAHNEAVDLYDIILSHLLDEGYADTQEAAEAIMVNMSEEWRESIFEEVLDEGQKKYPTERVENAGNSKVRILKDPNISPEKRLKTTKQLNTITTSFMSHLTGRPQPVPPKRKNN